MTPKLRGFHSPDVADFDNYEPANKTDFFFLLQIIVGPNDGPGEESFDVVVCSPNAFAREIGPETIEMGRHHLFMNNYSHDALVSFIRQYCDRCSGATWDDVAAKLGRLGKWEFEDYHEHPIE